MMRVLSWLGVVGVAYWAGSRDLVGVLVNTLDEAALPSAD